MHIRRATPDDILSILRVEQQCETAAHWTFGQYQALFEAGMPPCIALVATGPPPNVQVQGFVIGRPVGSDWEIENLAVATSQQRRGIGSTLVRELIARLQNTGVTELLLEVRESNTAARRLYEKLGFRQEGRRRGYYNDPKEDALLLRLKLQMCDKIS